MNPSVCVFGSGLQGPLMGGLLAEPARTMPTIFSTDGLFGRYPYLLPCLGSATLSLVGLLLAVFFIEETLDPRFRSAWP